MDRRAFLQSFAIAATQLGPVRLLRAAEQGDVISAAADLLAPFGNVGLLHITDTHAQLLPVHYREPDTNLGTGPQKGRPPHLTGDAFVAHFGLARDSADAHAFAHLDFETAARAFGRMGGYAHLATLVARLRDARPGALLLDGGDAWQGSATALWTGGADMAEATVALGVDVMTAHWEFTLGQERLIELLDDVQRAGVRFVAHNVRTADFEDPVFAAFALEEVNGVPVAVIGQAFPYVPVAHPKRFTPDWTFGLREDALQSVVDAARVQGAQVVVVLSHNGTDTDLKLASRLRGVDAILGGHTHDALPGALPVRTVDGGTTLVTNSGSNGKFVGVLDLDVHDGRVRDARWRLLPVFSNLIPADPEMAATIERLRAPYAAKLAEPLGIADRLLWRRGNFAGPWDHLILAALRDTLDCPVALSPGFRWGTTLLPGEPITREALYAQTAITYPETTITEMSGAQLHAVLEDVADNLFNPDPYQQQGGDMVRSAGLAYRVDPDAPRGQRIVDLRSADGTPLDPARRLRVAGWASVGEQPAAGAPIWDVVERWLAAR